MSFKNERISEVDRNLFNSFNLQNPVTRKLLTPRGTWTIDRDRKAYLIGLGGRGSYESEIPMFYALIWENDTIMIETYNKGDGDFSTGVEMYWKITRIEAPKGLLDNKDEMIELIKEAFDARGVAGRRDCVTKVTFDFIAEPLFYEDSK